MAGSSAPGGDSAASDLPAEGNSPAAPRHPDTSVIRAGRSDQPDSLAPALFPSTNFTTQSTVESQRKAQDLTERRFYGRHSNPTVGAFEEAMAELEGAEAARAFSSGMGAISSVVLALCRSGDHIVAQRELYGASYVFFKWVQERFNIEVTFVGGHQAADFAAAVRPGQTKLVFAETPSNPLQGTVDLSQLGAIAGPTVVVDSTAAPPTSQRPLEWGVDLSLHSATKSIAGHNDAMLGVVSGSDDLLAWIRSYGVLHGANASPFDAMNGLRGLRTLALRTERQSATAAELAQLLTQHPAVAQVWFPGLESDPGFSLARQQMKLPGGMVAFKLAVADGADPQPVVAKFMAQLTLAQQATSMGGPETLVTQPYTTTHSGLWPEELEQVGLTPDIIRVSLGLEHPADLLADFSQALDAVLA